MLPHSFPRLGLLATHGAVVLKPLEMSFNMLLYVSLVLVGSVAKITLPNSTAKFVHNCLHRLSNQGIKICKAANYHIRLGSISSLVGYWTFLGPCWFEMCICRLLLVLDCCPQYGHSFAPGKCVSMWRLMMDLSLLDLSQRWHIHMATPSTTVLLRDWDIRPSRSEVETMAIRIFISPPIKCYKLESNFGEKDLANKGLSRKAWWNQIMYGKYIIIDPSGVRALFVAERSGHD